jgi:hypothetical protein
MLLGEYFGELLTAKFPEQSSVTSESAGAF